GRQHADHRGHGRGRHRGTGPPRRGRAPAARADHRTGGRGSGRRRGERRGRPHRRDRPDRHAGPDRRPHPPVVRRTDRQRRAVPPPHRGLQLDAVGLQRPQGAARRRHERAGRGLPVEHRCGAARRDRRRCRRGPADARGRPGADDDAGRHGGPDDRRRGHHRLRDGGAEPRHDGQRGPPPDQVRRRLDQDHGHRADPVDEGSRGPGLEARGAAHGLRHRARAEHARRGALPQRREHPRRRPRRGRPDLPRLLPRRRGARRGGGVRRGAVPDVHPAGQPGRLRRQGRQRAGAAGGLPRGDRGHRGADGEGARGGRPVPRRVGDRVRGHPGRRVARPRAGDVRAVHGHDADGRHRRGHPQRGLRHAHGGRGRHARTGPHRRRARRRRRPARRHHRPAGPRAHRRGDQGREADGPGDAHPRAAGARHRPGAVPRLLPAHPRARADRGADREALACL
ncbi:MAG: hypothetical protein AVDCRST_MAG66-1822, partial [uncultured Pseudonocardia sp.]